MWEKVDEFDIIMRILFTVGVDFFNGSRGSSSTISWKGGGGMETEWVNGHTSSTKRTDFTLQIRHILEGIIEKCVWQHGPHFWYFRVCLRERGGGFSFQVYVGVYKRWRAVSNLDRHLVNQRRGNEMRRLVCCSFYLFLIGGKLKQRRSAMFQNQVSFFLIKWEKCEHEVCQDEWGREEKKDMRCCSRATGMTNGSSTSDARVATTTSYICRDSDSDAHVILIRGEW